MIKYLQFATCSQVIVIVMTGLWVLIFEPLRMTAYGQMCGSLLPFIAPQIAAAFGGTHLKNYMADRKEITRMKAK